MKIQNDICNAKNCFTNIPLDDKIAMIIKNVHYKVKIKNNIHKNRNRRQNSYSVFL